MPERPKSRKGQPRKGSRGRLEKPAKDETSAIGPLRAFRTMLGIGFRSAPWQASIQFLTGAAFAAAPPVVAYGGKLIVDAAVDKDLSLGLTGAAIVALVGGLTILCVFVYCDCVFKVFERAGAFASRRLMQLMGGTNGLAHHERPKYLDQVQRIREDEHSLGAMVNGTAGMIRVTATLTVTAILLARLHPILLLLPVLGFVSFWLGKRARDLDVAAQEATSEPERLRRHLFDVGTSAAVGKELRIFGASGVLLDRHHATSSTVIATRNVASWHGAVLSSIDGLVLVAGYVGAVTLVLVSAVRGTATAGDVVLVVGLAASVGSMVGTAVGYGTQFLRVVRAGQRLCWLEDYAVADTPAVSDEGSSGRNVHAVRVSEAYGDGPIEPPARLEQGITLQSVRFGYPETDRPILSDLSVRLPAGKVVALVGENGAGKTTLIKLLCGFYRQDAGRVMVDNLDLSRMPPEQWRARVGAAFQDFAMFEFLARETVGVADLPRIEDRDAVGAALERAGASSVVDVLPRGLETQLGKGWDGGVDLSGGQWQKLALGRGLMREDPLLVVFDEPTAALDAQTEHVLFERFAEATRTGADRGTVTLLVSHRFSTVRMADLILVLDGGRIVEQGDHDELMAAGGLYAELYTLQSNAYR